MRTSLRLSVLGLGVVIALALASVPASAGESPILKVAKKRSGPYHELLEINLGAGKSKEFFLKARNASGADPQSANLQELGFPIFKTKYFRGEKNISLEVKGDGFEFTVTDNPKRFRGIIKDTDAGAEHDCLEQRLQVESGDFDDANIAVNGECAS